MTKLMHGIMGRGKEGFYWNYALILGSQIPGEANEHSDIKFCFSFLKINFCNSKTKKVTVLTHCPFLQ